MNSALTIIRLAVQLGMTLALTAVAAVGIFIIIRTIDAVS